MYLVHRGRELLLFLMKSPCLLNCVRYDDVLPYKNNNFKRLALSRLFGVLLKLSTYIFGQMLGVLRKHTHNMQY